MIAKCIAVLAIVAQINAYNCNQQPITFSNSRSNMPVVWASESSDNNLFGRSSTESPITRNIVAKGKYPVALDNYGPAPDKQIPITTSQVRVPVQEKPTIRLPANIPAPRTVSHSCTCYKTILKPRVYQHIITVPSVQRYLETSHTPVFENVQYEATPVDCESSSNSGSQIEAVEIPSVRVPRIQTVEIPRLQAVEIPQVQTFRLSQLQGFQIPQAFTGSVPVVQSLGSDCYPCNQF